MFFGGLVLRVGFSFLFDPTFNTSPESHLQKGCHVSIHIILETQDLGIHVQRYDDFQR